MSADIRTLDLNFRGLQGGIASYLIPHEHGCVLVESGPGSTIAALRSGLAEHGFEIGDVTDVLLTHIHLDHAGAAGWLAGQGARVHVHPNGAAHLIDPGKLIASATRIYGEMMDTLWGEFLPVPEEKLSIPADRDVIEIEGLAFRAIDTPGHASHHYSYILDDVAFTGDVGGVRLGGLRELRLPMPPPEFNPEQWRASLRRLRDEFEEAGTRQVAPTHFGVYTDPDWHLAAIAKALDEVEEWMLAVMPRALPIEELRTEFVEWIDSSPHQDGWSERLGAVQESVNPAFMSADGIQRYWRKFRTEPSA